MSIRLVCLVFAGLLAAATSTAGLPPPQQVEETRRWAQTHWPGMQCPDSGNSIVFFKSHKTGSTTLANLFLRLGLRRRLVPFECTNTGNRYVLDCPEDFRTAGHDHDFAVSHFNGVGTAKGLTTTMAWQVKRKLYAGVLRTAGHFQTYTVVREPRSTFVSKYWSVLPPPPPPFTPPLLSRLHVHRWAVVISTRRRRMLSTPPSESVPRLGLSVDPHAVRWDPLRPDGVLAFDHNLKRGLQPPFQCLHAF